MGRPLTAFQALQHRAVDVYREIELAGALVGEIARVADEGGPHALDLIAAARAKAAETALETAKWAVQSHGAMGFADEGGVGPYLKRAMTLCALYRTPQAHRARFEEASWRPGARLLESPFHVENEADRAFRAQVRAFLDAELPAEALDLPIRPPIGVARWWHKRLFEQGWIAPAWPAAYGGMGASIERQLILAEELSSKGAPELSSQGTVHIGPTLIRFGTEAQKARFLPKILSGEERWCQGYSEPGAGSDLAALATRGRVEGERIIVDGSKIWTTGAQHADWMFALVRTDPDAADKRKGISMVLIDMKSPGISVRPIRTIAGDEEFAQVFFDGVSVSRENLVGALNEGWRVSNSVLEDERLMNSSPQKIAAFAKRVRRVAVASGMSEDAGFRDRLARAEIDALAAAALFARALGLSRAGRSTGPHASLLKLQMAELIKLFADLMFEAAAGEGALVEPLVIDGAAHPVGLTFLQTRRASIYGGTSEIMRDIVARRILDMAGTPKR